MKMQNRSWRKPREAAWARSGEPALFGNTLVAHVVMGMRRRALDLLRIAVEIVADGEANHAAVVDDHPLGVRIHLLALGFVELGPGGDDDLVEVGALPGGVVPVRRRQEGLRQLV